MTTQGQQLGADLKAATDTLAAAMIDAADKHGTAIVAASMHIHTGLSQIAEALGYKNPAGRRQDAPGRPRMPGRKETPTEPLRDAQDAQRHRKPLAETDWPDTAPPDLTDPEPQWSEVLATAANPATVRDLINRAKTAEHRLQQLLDNTPEPKSEWLDADTLDDMPGLTVAITRGGTEPRWRDETGEWCLLGHNGLRGIASTELAPARVLWAPEADRRP